MKAVHMGGMRGEIPKKAQFPLTCHPYNRSCYTKALNLVNEPSPGNPQDLGSPRAVSSGSFQGAVNDICLTLFERPDIHRMD